MKTLSVYICDTCSKEFLVSNIQKAKYCPHCGYHDVTYRKEVYI